MVNLFQLLQRRLGLRHERVAIEIDLPFGIPQSIEREVQLCFKAFLGALPITLRGGIFAKAEFAEPRENLRDTQPLSLRTDTRLYFLNVVRSLRLCLFIAVSSFVLRCGPAVQASLRASSCAVLFSQRLLQEHTPYHRGVCGVHAFRSPQALPVRLPGMSHFVLNYRLAGVLPERHWAMPVSGLRNT